MSDLISRQAAIDAMSCVNDGICAGQAIDALWELPTIDAVHVVVRCKDCRFYETREKGGDSYCARFSADPYEYLPMEDDDFCSRGVEMERSEDGGEGEKQW